MGSVRGAYGRSNRHRFSRANFAGQGEFRGLRAGAPAQLVHTPYRRHGPMVIGSSVRVSSAAADDLLYGFPARRHGSERPAVAGRGGILSRARPRRYGARRCENDGDGWRVFGITTRAFDDLIGIAARKFHRRGGYCPVAKRAGFRTPLRNFPRCGSLARGFFWFSNPRVVPFLLDGAIEGHAR